MWFEDLTSSLLNRLFPKPSGATPAGIFVGTQVDPPHTLVVFPDRHRNQHLVVVGKTGFGKTHALEFVVTQLAERGEGFAFFDFHGDASLSLIGRLLQRPRAEERLIVVDPSHPTRSPGINVLASHAAEADRFRKVSEIASILRQRWGVDSFGARTEELLRNGLYTLAGTGRTLADLPKLLTDAAVRRGLADEVEHPDVQSYWRDRYEPLSEGMKAAFREPLLNRVTAFLTEPAARHLLGQSESTVDVSEVMRHQQWLIIRLPKGRLREHAHTLGNLLFAQLQFAALAREALPLLERRTFTLVCDEVQNLAENDLGTLITEGRKFGISIITANQFWEQLPKELRGALLSAASHICFRVSSADAGILAGELNLERRSRLTVDLTNLARGEAIGRFGSEPVMRFRVPALPVVSPVSATVLESLIAPITRPREEIERQLRQPALAEASPVSSTAESPLVKEGQHDW
jgi:hypothetical protein